MYEDDRSYVEIQGPEALIATNRKKIIDYGVMTTLDFGREGIKKIDEDGVLTQYDLNFDLGPSIQFNLPHIGLSDEDNFILRFYYQTKLQDFGKRNTFRAVTRYFTKIAFFLRIEFELEYSRSNSEYLSFYYGVNERASNLFGINEYIPDTGDHYLYYGSNIIFSFSETDGIFMRYAATRLSDIAYESPYVNQFGSRNQQFIAAAYFYRW